MRSGFLGHVSELVKQSDLVAEILDARYPERTRNEQLENMVLKNGKRLVLVMNKADLISKADAEHKKDDLGEETGMKVIFLSAKEKDGINLLRREISESLGEKSGTVGIIGYPNTGKSSLINALAGRGRGRVATSRKAGLTRGITKVKVSEGWYLLDSPGIIPFGEDEFDLFLVESKNPNQLKDVIGTALKLIQFLGNERIEKGFSFAKGELEGKDENELLEMIAKKKRLIRGGGKADEDRAAREILEAYQRHEI